MVDSKIWHGIGVLLMIPHMVFGSSAAEHGSRDMALCVLAAKDALVEFNLSEKIIINRCKCVREKRDGRLPSSISAWSRTEKSNPLLDLIECAEQDIIDIYSAATFRSASGRMKQEGVKVEKIKRFSTCVGESAYAELHRLIARPEGEAYNFDSIWIRQMYSFCETAIK